MLRHRIDEVVFVMSGRMNTGSDGSDFIGTASLEEDGALVLDLHRSFETRLNFHKILRIKPSNPQYQKYIDHLGGINPGERKRIPVWPEG